MVDVAGRGVAERRRTSSVIAEEDQLAEFSGEAPTVGVHGDQVIRAWSRVEAPEPDLGRRVLRPGADGWGRDRAVARQPGRFFGGARLVAGTEESAVGHHQMDLDGERGARSTSRQQLKSRVDGNLSRSALTGVSLRETRAGLRRVLGDRCVGSDNLGERCENRQERHAIRRRANRDPPALHGRSMPSSHRRGIELCRYPSSLRLRLPQRQRRQPVAEAAVNLRTVLSRQTRGLCQHLVGHSFGDLTRLEQAPHPRHLGRQHPSQRDSAVTPPGRLSARQGDVGTDEPYRVSHRLGRVTNRSFSHRAELVGGSRLKPSKGVLQQLGLGDHLDDVPLELLMRQVTAPRRVLQRLEAGTRRNKVSLRHFLPQDLQPHGQHLCPTCAEQRAHRPVRPRRADRVVS